MPSPTRSDTSTDDDVFIDYDFEEDLRTLAWLRERVAVVVRPDTLPTAEKFRCRTLEEIDAPYQDPENRADLCEELGDSDLRPIFEAMGPGKR